jgi:predicted RecA/RadA family phage recombinase
MRNYTGVGDTLTLTAPYDVASGGGALIGATFGVSKLPLKAGQRGPFELTGAYDLPKDNAAVAEGARAYWDTAGKVVTATANGTPVGVFTAARSAGAASANVRLNGAF